ncbi:SH3 domain-containing protein [Microbaculum marinisediminis]|uniref:SH3 domain-containing protein n=1 Tax=Microbaculum marinisediminis TaxID=2931392 RepID=A0AAW5QWV4_9HYPH|nr:SH3 domain-containing protein [Microbaculum sp. A6E488]MCT8970775.1 SH3 domain-containing protein [Microbaculum sp. A6E488]
MRIAVALGFALLAGAAPALAAPAVTTANVNFRSGPGTGYASMGTLPQGTQVDMGECNDAGSWCAVTVNGQSGFVSGQYLEETEDPQAWPRAYTTDSGATVVLHQPQVTAWDNFTDVSGLIAAEYKPTEDASAVFGVIGVSGKTQADHETGEVLIDDLKITELNFSVLSREQLSDMALEVGKLLPTEPITMSLQRLTASLAAYEQLGDVEGLKSDPPPIYVSETPAILIQTEGEAVAAPIEAVDGLSFVVNTNWDLFKVDPDGAYYVRDEKSWLSASTLTGDWQPVSSLPEVFSKLPDDDSWKDAREAMPPAAYEAGKAPRVIYTDTPAELIVFEGTPALEAVPGTNLEWASNTETDAFFLTTTKTWYVLFSGRWFSSQSLEGPWAFATTSLPDDFRRIPDDQPYYTVRASVPGTSESDEARLKAMIPQMARVETDGSVTAAVEYTGDPDFQPIEGTELAYAANTQDQVIRVGDKYYVLKDGVWFVGDSPTGPFAVATAVPDAIYEIPPSSPVYNATYVRVYDTSPGVVWFGYTMGYLGAYLAWDNLVYGTGWYYRPYWGWYGPRRYPIYYPRPFTYGCACYYNPVRGIYGRYGYAYGPYRGLGRVSYYNANTNRYVRAGWSSGPAGSRGFVAAYNPATGRGGFAAGGRNVYRSWNAAGITGVTGGTAWVRSRSGAVATANANRWRTPMGATGFNAGRRPGDNVFAGRNGQVYRHQNGQWQQRTGNSWGAVKKPSAPSLSRSAPGMPKSAPAGIRAPAKAKPAARPNMPQKPSFQPKAKMPSQPAIRAPQNRNVPSHLRSDQFGRQLGNKAAHQQRMQARPPAQFRAPSAPRGGVSRGGGGVPRGQFGGGGGRRR